MRFTVFSNALSRGVSANEQKPEHLYLRNYHSESQLLQCHVLETLPAANTPHTIVDMDFDQPLIFFRFVDWQMGHLGMFNISRATALLYAICAGVRDSLISSTSFLSHHKSVS